MSDEKLDNAESEALPEIEPEVQLATLQTELAEANTKLDEAQDRLLRTQADMENVRRRAAQDVEKAHQYGLEKFAKELLAVVDSLEHAEASHVAHAQDIDTDVMASLQGGLELTLKMMRDTLVKFNIKTIDPAGESFDPNHHEAMSMQPSQEAPPNTVLSVVQKGYLLGDRLLRPARVVISRQAESE